MGGWLDGWMEGGRCLCCRMEKFCFNGSSSIFFSCRLLKSLGFYWLILLLCGFMHHLLLPCVLCTGAIEMVTICNFEQQPCVLLVHEQLIERGSLVKLCNVFRFADNLEQLTTGKKIPPSGWSCEKCGMKENLWLNLTDGAILCGRKFWDGSGGNNHAIEHYDLTKYPLAVKLGTITPDGAGERDTDRDGERERERLRERHRESQ